MPTPQVYARVREELEQANQQIQQYDETLSRYTSNEGDDAPWDIMESEFMRLRKMLHQVKTLHDHKLVDGLTTDLVEEINDYFNDVPLSEFEELTAEKKEEAK